MEKQKPQEFEMNELMHQPVNEPEYIPGETQATTQTYIAARMNPLHRSEQRQTWKTPIEHLVAKASYVFGYSSVLRFPYFMYRYGGVPYLFAYIIMLYLVGFPLFLLESSMGQFSSSGVLACWEMFPLFKGVGVVLVFTAVGLCSFLAVMNAWAINYFFYSWTKNLPWSSCANSWNTPNCVVESAEENNDNNYNSYAHNISDTSMNFDYNNMKVLSSDEFFINYVLNVSNGIENLSSPQLKIVLGLLATWIIICMVLAFGPKVYGKVAFITSIVPLLLLFILMIRSATLPGSSEGLKYLFYPDWPQLKNKELWMAAIGEVIFSLGLGSGSITTLSSYSKFRNNCVRDAFVILIIQLAFLIFAAITIMSLVGFIAEIKGLPITEIMDFDFELRFSTLPTAFSKMPVGPFWSSLFYLFLVLIGFGTLFGIVETIITAVVDLNVLLYRLRPFITIGVCVFLFIIGIPFTTRGGLYLFAWVDGLFIFTALFLILKLVCVVFAYGIFSRIFTNASWFRYKDDLILMLGGKGCHFVPWLICWPIWSIIGHIMWIFGTPVLLAFYWRENLASYFTYAFHLNAFGMDYRFPDWVVSIGMMLEFLVILCIVLTPVVLVVMQCCCGKSNLSESLVYLIKPSRFWGPALPKYREGMSKYVPENKFEVDPWTSIAHL